MKLSAKFTEYERDKQCVGMKHYAEGWLQNNQPTHQATFDAPSVDAPLRPVAPPCNSRIIHSLLISTCPGIIICS